MTPSLVAALLESKVPFIFVGILCENRLHFQSELERALETKSDID